MLARGRPKATRDRSNRRNRLAAIVARGCRRRANERSLDDVAAAMRCDSNSARFKSSRRRASVTRAPVPTSPNALSRATVRADLAAVPPMPGRMRMYSSGPSLLLLLSNCRSRRSRQTASTAPPPTPRPRWRGTTEICLPQGEVVQLDQPVARSIGRVAERDRRPQIVAPDRVVCESTAPFRL